MNKTIILFTLLSLFSFNAFSFEAGEIFTTKEWKAEVVESHQVWEQAACVAYTSDRDSKLEVTSLYDPNSDTFSEPTVNILSPFGVSFFDVKVTVVDGVSSEFDFFPFLPNSEDPSTVGARALFNDRQTLVANLKRGDAVVAKYFDATGEIQSLDFSLSGSSDTINALFAACELEITLREELDLEIIPAQ